MHPRSIVVGNAGGAASAVHLNDAEGGPSAIRADLTSDIGTPLAGSSGKETMDVAISGGSARDGTPLDMNGDGYPDIVLAVDGGHNLIYYGSPPPNLGAFSSTAPYEIGVPSTDGSGNAADPIKNSQSVTLIDVDGDGDTDAGTCRGHKRTSVPLLALFTLAKFKR